MKGSYARYNPPKEHYVAINNRIVDKYEIDVIGLYSKLVRISSGKALNMSFIAKKFKVSQKKLRSIIVLLETDGYVTREAIKDASGHFCGWLYDIWSEPVSDKQKTHAGKADGLYQKRTSPSTDMTENGKEIISDNTIIYNDEENNSSINTPVKDDKEKDAYASKSTRTEEELTYEKKMKEQFPRIMRMEQPLTLEQAKNLKKRYDSDLLMKIMQDMENWKPLIKKNVSAYKTIINWCDRENERA